jgi:hypothetical protein
MVVIAAMLTIMVGRSGVCPVATFTARGASGRVCYESNAKCTPIPGAHIELSDEVGNVIRGASTDQAGAFRIETESPGEFTLKVSANGFRAVECRLIAKKTGKSDKRLKAVLGSDAILPCGGSRIAEDSI